MYVICYQNQIIRPRYISNSLPAKNCKQKLFDCSSIQYGVLKYFAPWEILLSDGIETFLDKKLSDFFDQLI